MVAMGPAEILFFVLLGASPADMLSLVHGEDYFRSRKIDITVDKMIELAGKDPVDGKTQLQQLLALRQLGADADEVKKSPQGDAALKLLTQIANGLKSDDQHGFAREYARTALAQLQGKEQSAYPIPPGRGGEFAWFPAAATLVGAAHFGGGSLVNNDLAKLRKLWTAKIPPQDKDHVYTIAETLGNLRIQSIAFALVDEPNADARGRAYVRITGKGDRQRLIDVLEKHAGWTTTKKGEVAVLRQNERAPAIAFIGARDVVIAGYQRTDKQDQQKLIDEVLELRSSEGKGNVLSGKFKELVPRIPATSTGVLIGELPEGMRKELLRAGNLTALPKIIFATMKRGKAMQLNFEAEMSNDDEAKTFSKEIHGLRDQGIALLQKAAEQVGAPAKILDNLRKSLESIKVTAEGKSLQGSAQIEGNLGELIPYLLLERAESKTPSPKQPKDN